MKHVELARKTKSSSHWTRLAAVSLLAVAALAGCGGGSDGAAGAPGTNGTDGTDGANGKDLTAVVNLATVSATDWAALTPVATVSSVVINSPPVVTFSVVDGYKRPVVGLTTSQLRFAIAKLVPGADGSQSKWVSYMVGNATTGEATRPGTENVAANLVDNKDGTYKYTFASDVTGPLQTKIVNWFGSAATKNVTSSTGVVSTFVKTDVLGADGKLLDYAPTLQHRLAIQLSGSANGGTLANPVNVIYDFVPATSAVVAAADVQREVVSIDSCNTCHEKLAFHGGGRVDTRYCVVCHTDQRKNGVNSAVSTALKFPALIETKTVNATTGITSYSYAREDKVPNSYVYDNEVAGNFTTMVHKIHNGSALVKQNYNYANVAFNNKGYSMLDNGQKMCSTCHDSTKAKQANNWSTQPSRLACGSCHDGINFANGAGTTLAGATTGHASISLAQTSDVACTICHSADTIKVYHQTENITKHNPTIAAGLATFTYEIKSAEVNGTSNELTVVFKISKNGTALTALPAAGFTGSPSFLLAWAESQDGITTPVDYNNKGVKQAQAKSAAITTGLTGPVDGYFTSVIPSASAFPSGAKMRAVALQGYYTQAAGTDGIAVATPRHAISVVKAVTGDAVRRTVVASAKCSNCHEWFEGHGGNRVYETQVCVMCHVPGLATSGRGSTQTQIQAYPFSAADDKKLTEWGINPVTFGDGVDDALQYPVTSNTFKDMIHGIHAGRDRVTPFKDARNRTGTQTLLDFRRMDFPGKLNNCETCHAAGTYSNVSLNALASTYESVNSIAGNTTALLANTSLNTHNDYDKVTSPYAASCVSCHDSVPAQAHIRASGGQIQVARNQLVAFSESCATCHAAGKANDVAVVHK